MTAVFNTSPLIFLARLGYLEKTLSLFQMVAIPKKVIKEISVKDDEANEKVLKIKNHSNGWPPISFVKKGVEEIKNAEVLSGSE